jgi:curved DNA-binding protein CbpA
MVRVNPDPYLVLGVSPTATQAEITHAYRTRLRAHHPDTRQTPSSQTADEHLRQLLAAYALLRDPTRRADYDRATAHTATPPSNSPTGPTPADRPSPARSRSRSPTATPPPQPPTSQHHHCGPAPCAATASPTAPTPLFSGTVSGADGGVTSMLRYRPDAP